MPPASVSPGRTSNFLYTLLLLWLAGASMRITVLVVPPVIPLMHAELHLSQTDIGILSGLPLLVFAVAAIPGSLLISRFGILRTLIAGLVATGFASALRGAAPDALLLFATTLLMSAGIAIMQPALPPLVRDWAPHRIGLATAVYANGMLLGETLAVAITLPLVTPLVGGSWRWTLVVWALPVLLVALLFALRGVRKSADAPAASGRPTAPRRWWPDWRDAMTWKVGLIMGGASGLYFGSNAFLPDHLAEIERPELLSAALTSLNMSQLVASAVLLVWARQLVGRRWPFIAIGLLGVASVTGLVLADDAWLLLWSGLIGFCGGFTITLGLALPPLLAAPADVHRVSAAMFTICYACALLVPVLGGLGWDLSGRSLVAFVPAGLCALGITLLGARLSFDRPGVAATP